MQSVSTMSGADPAVKKQKLTEVVMNNKSTSTEILTGDLLGPISECLSIEDTFTPQQNEQGRVRERLESLARHPYSRLRPHMPRQEPRAL
jgi:hypothetical protein